MFRLHGDLDLKIGLTVALLAAAGGFIALACGNVKLLYGCLLVLAISNVITVLRYIW